MPFIKNKRLFLQYGMIFFAFFKDISLGYCYFLKNINILHFFLFTAMVLNKPLQCAVLFILWLFWYKTFYTHAFLEFIWPILTLFLMSLFCRKFIVLSSRNLFFVFMIFYAGYFFTFSKDDTALFVAQSILFVLSSFLIKTT